MMTQYCKYEILIFVGVFEKHILTYSICICLKLGLFRKCYLGHVNIWLTGKWVFLFYPTNLSILTKFLYRDVMTFSSWKDCSGNISSLVTLLTIHGTILFYCSWNNDLVVKTLYSQSRDPKFKTTGWLQDWLSWFHPSEVNNMSSRNCRGLFGNK